MDKSTIRSIEKLRFYKIFFNNEVIDLYEHENIDTNYYNFKYIKIENTFLDLFSKFLNNSALLLRSDFYKFLINYDVRSDLYDLYEKLRSIFFSVHYSIHYFVSFVYNYTVYKIFLESISVYSPTKNTVIVSIFSLFINNLVLDYKNKNKYYNSSLNKEIYNKILFIFYYKYNLNCKYNIKLNLIDFDSTHDVMT